MTAPGLAELYPDGVLMALLRAPLETDPGAGVGTLLPADVAARLPYLAAREVPGGGTADDRFAHAVSLQLDGFADSRRAARLLVTRALVLLRDAQRAQTVTADGHLAHLTVTAFPAELREPDQPDAWFRYVAGCAAIFRPPTS